MVIPGFIATSKIRNRLLDALFLAVKWNATEIASCDVDLFYDLHQFSREFFGRKARVPFRINFSYAYSMPISSHEDCDIVQVWPGLRWVYTVQMD